MSEVIELSADPINRPARSIGWYLGDTPGPRWILVGGLHGNEPDGEEAIDRVLEHLNRERPAFRGSIFGVRGNTRALATGVRAIDRDLNRGWRREHVDSLRAGAKAENAEDLEMLELLDHVEPLAVEAEGAVHYVDLHCTSGDAPPFLVMADEPENRRAVHGVEAPIIFGLESIFAGTFVDHLRDEGHVGFSFEGGKRCCPASRDFHVALLWTLFESHGCLAPESVPDRHEHRERLARAGADLPRAVHVRYRHAVTPADSFEMAPGFRTFDRIEPGDELGRDRAGAVKAPIGGYLLLPLYQKQGSDGFFIGQA